MSSASEKSDEDSETVKKTPNKPFDLDLIHVYRVHGNRYLEIEVYASTMKIKSGKLELERYLKEVHGLGSLFFYQKVDTMKIESGRLEFERYLQEDLDLDIKKLCNDGKIYLAKTLRDVPFKNLQQSKDQVKSKPIPRDAIQATTIPSKYENFIQIKNNLTIFQKLTI